jgi:uridylate kinase
MPIIVFGLEDGNIARVVRGEKIGTLVHAMNTTEGTRP